jgi:hypothetical protein
MDLIQYSKITPFKKILKRWALGIEISKCLGCLLPGFCIPKVPQNIVILNLLNE